jgi:arylsulfatase A-like enzyme
MWAPHGIHTPLQAPTAYTDKFANLLNDATFSATSDNAISRGNYAAIVNSVDDQFGLVMKALKDKGMVRLL